MVHVYGVCLSEKVILSFPLYIATYVYWHLKNECDYLVSCNGSRNTRIAVTWDILNDMIHTYVT